jgi:hypothetical protein
MARPNIIFSFEAQEDLFDIQLYIVVREVLADC